jgi:hypothetical protein
MTKSEKNVYRGSYLTGHRGPPGPAPPTPMSKVLQSCVPPPRKPNDVTVKIIVR